MISLVRRDKGAKAQSEERVSGDQAIRRQEIRVSGYQEAGYQGIS